jgi:hypothetical protein
MNFNAWEKIWPEHWNARLISPAFVFIGLPLAVAIMVLSLWPERDHQPSYQKLQSALLWNEPLPPNTKFNYIGLVEISKYSPDLSSVVWATVTIPQVVSLPLKQAKDEIEPVARAWYRFQAMIPDDINPAEPYALYATRIMSSAYSVWINGKPIFADLDDWRIQWNYPVLIQIPFDHLKPGTHLNIDLALPHQSNQGYALGSVYFGRSNELRSLSTKRQYLQITLPIVGMFLVAIMGIFSLLMWRKRPSETENLWLALTAVFVVVCNLQYICDFTYSDMRSTWFGSLVDSSSAWIFLAYFIFALTSVRLKVEQNQLLSEE